jgi:hypothetical protein
MYWGKELGTQWSAWTEVVREAPNLVVKKRELGTDGSPRWCL